MGHSIADALSSGAVSDESVGDGGRSGGALQLIDELERLAVDVVGWA